MNSETGETNVDGDEREEEEEEREDELAEARGTRGFCRAQ
jgi:hypothetical protein